MNFDNFPSVVVHKSEKLKQFPIGYLPSSYERSMLLGGDGVCLPVLLDPSDSTIPYCRKDFGRGLDLSTANGALLAVNALHLRPEHKHVHFAISLGCADIPEEGFDTRQNHPGRLTFSCRPQADSGLFAPSRMLTEAINPQGFATKENWSGYAGTVEVSTSRGGWYEFGIHGSAQGVLLHWIAMSAT